MMPKEDLDSGVVKLGAIAVLAETNPITDITATIQEEDVSSLTKQDLAVGIEDSVSLVLEEGVVLAYEVPSVPFIVPDTTVVYERVTGADLLKGGTRICTPSSVEDSIV